MAHDWKWKRMASDGGCRPDLLRPSTARFRHVPARNALLPPASPPRALSRARSGAVSPGWTARARGWVVAGKGQRVRDYTLAHDLAGAERSARPGIALARASA